MAIDSGLLSRMKAVVNSPSLAVLPVGGENEPGRAIFGVRDFGRLQDVVKATFAVAVLAAAAALPTIAHAQGVGYDANVYGQAQSQVMQVGSAVRMTVLDVRPVKIEVASAAQAANPAIGYAVTAAAGGAGAVIGGSIGGNNQSVRQLGAILGGLAGVLAGNMANEAMNAPPAKMVDGTEITLEEAGSGQVRVVTQAGGAQFSPGDPVLVATVGGSARVMADRSRAVQHVAQMDAGNAHASQRTVDASAQDYPDAPGVAAPGVTRSGTATGKILDVDLDTGIVLQKRGGELLKHDLSKLSMRPAVGDMVKISYDQRGVGVVQDLGRDSGRSVGGR